MILLASENIVCRFPIVCPRTQPGRPPRRTLLSLLVGTLILWGCGGGGVSGGTSSLVTLQIQSGGLNGVPIGVSPADTSGQTDGVTPFQRIFNSNTQVVLVAPTDVNGIRFTHWQTSWGGTTTSNTLQLTLYNDTVVTAVYDTGTCDGDEFLPNYVYNLTALLHWPGIPVNIYFVQDQYYTDSLRATALAGFDEWTSSTNGGIYWVVTTNSNDAHIRVSFTPTLSGNTLGITTFSYSGDILLPVVDMKIRTAFNGAPLLDGDIQEIAAHEMGHAMGIYGHSDQPSDVMYPSQALGIVHYLTLRDTNTMKTGYCWLFLPGIGPSGIPPGPSTTCTLYCPEAR